LQVPLDLIKTQQRSGIAEHGRLLHDNPSAALSVHPFLLLSLNDLSAFNRPSLFDWKPKP
jgi:hypothetical protein